MKGENRMTEDEHRERHRKLHRALDELVADWLSQTNNLPSRASVLDLMRWAAEQAGVAGPPPESKPEPVIWERGTVVCGGCMHYGATEEEAMVVPIWTGIWVCPKCNNRLCYDGPEAGKQEQPERQILSRGISPMRAQRLSMVKVACPGCMIVIETVAAKTLICPKCRTLFAMTTKEIFGKARL